MTIFSLAEFADRMRIQSVKWDISRFDEYAGSGTGHDLQSELAKPKWAATVNLARSSHDQAKQMATLARKLQGMQHAFMLCDPAAQYPQFDPDGSLLSGHTPLISSVSGAVGIALKGLPSGYQITASDRGQVVFGSAPERNYYFEFNDAGTAGVGGITPVLGVFPSVPAGVVANATVILIRPACKMKLLGGAFDPGTADRVRTDGLSFRTIEAR
jgi:hypothetical protein